MPGNVTAFPIPGTKRGPNGGYLAPPHMCRVSRPQAHLGRGEGLLGACRHWKRRGPEGQSFLWEEWEGLLQTTLRGKRK